MKILESQYDDYFVGRNNEIQELKEKIANNSVVIVTGDRGIGKTNLIKVLEKHFQKEKKCHYIESGSLFSEEIKRYFLPEQITTGISSSISMLGIGGGGGKSWMPREPSILEYMEKSEEKIIFIENAHELKKVEFEIIFSAINRNNRLKFILEIATPYLPDIQLNINSEQVVELKELSNEALKKIIQKKYPKFSENILMIILFLSNGYPYVVMSLSYICEKKYTENEMIEFLKTFKDSDMRYNLNRIHHELLTILKKDEQEIIRKLAIAPSVFPIKLIEAFCSAEIDIGLSNLLNRGILKSENNLYWIYHPLFRDYLRNPQIQPIAIENKNELYREVMGKVKSDVESMYLLFEVCDDTDINIFKELIEISENLDVINEVGIQCRIIGELDRAIVTCQRILNISKKLNSKEWESIASGNMGIIFSIKGELDESKKYLEKSLKLNKELDNKAGIAEDYGDIGMIFQNEGNFVKSLNFLEKSLELNIELNLKNKIAMNYANMGVVYSSNQEFEKALEYFEKAIEINFELENTVQLATNYGGMGVIYGNIEEHDKALDCLNKSLILNVELGHKEGIAMACGSIGKIYFLKEDLNQTLSYFEKALKLNEELRRKKGIAINLINIGSVYKVKDETNKALKYYEKSLKLFDEIGSQLEIAQSLIMIGNIFAERGENDLALNNYLKAQNIALDYPFIFEEVSKKVSCLLGKE